VSRVLVSGGAGYLGAAVVRRLLADPLYEVRVADLRAAPQWMREGCEVHTGDLREPQQALAAVAGCTQVIHLGALVGAADSPQRLPHTLIEANTALDRALVRAALDEQTERLLYVSCDAVFEGAATFPTPEEHLADCTVPQSVLAFAKLTGEAYCRSAHREHGLPFTICRPSTLYGPGETPGGEHPPADPVAEMIGKVLSGQRPVQLPGPGERTRTLTHVEDAADGILLALGSPAALNQDFNLAAGNETSLDDLARLVWEACEEDSQELELEHLPAVACDPQRLWPAAEKARRLLGWEAQVDLRQGIASTAAWLRGLRVDGL
jgi:UDP-glucose 4-epimerase